MAQMKQIPLEEIKRSLMRLKVGNNREIQWYHVQGIFSGFLHGFEIFQYSPADKKVCLDSCGFPTVTTRRAMGDFLEYFNIPGGVSFAKGKFSARVQGQEAETNHDPITFTIY